MNALDVKKELLSQIQSYLNGEISKENFYDISECFYTENVHLIGETAFTKVYMQYIADACLIYIDEPGLQADEKEIKFRECLEKTYPILKGLIND